MGMWVSKSGCAEFHFIPVKTLSWLWLQGHTLGNGELIWVCRVGSFPKGIGSQGEESQSIGVTVTLKVLNHSFQSFEKVFKKRLFLAVFFPPKKWTESPPQISSLPVTLALEIHRVINNLTISPLCLNCISFACKGEISMDVSEPSASPLPEDRDPRVVVSEIYRLSVALCFFPLLPWAGWQMLAVWSG